MNCLFLWRMVHEHLSNLFLLTYHFHVYLFRLHIGPLRRVAELSTIAAASPFHCEVLIPWNLRDRRYMDAQMAH